MDGASIDALTRALALGERTRRDSLRVLAGSGAGMAALAAFAGADAKNKKKRKRKKKKKNQFKGDARCKCRTVLSSNGTCLDAEDPNELLGAACAVDPNTCLCVLDTKSAHQCVGTGGPLCSTECDSDDDCAGQDICVTVTGCCEINPALTRTCATPCDLVV